MSVYNSTQVQTVFMNTRWGLRDRQSVRRLCKILLVCCALGLLVCTAVLPGSGDDIHGAVDYKSRKIIHKNGDGPRTINMKELGQKDGKGYKDEKGHKSGMATMPDMVEMMEMESHKDHTNNDSGKSNLYKQDENHTDHVIRSDHGSYDLQNDTLEMDSIDLPHHMENTDDQIQRSIGEIPKHQENISSHQKPEGRKVKGVESRNKRYSNEDEMNGATHNKTQSNDTQSNNSENGDRRRTYRRRNMDEVSNAKNRIQNSSILRFDDIPYKGQKGNGTIRYNYKAKNGVQDKNEGIATTTASGSIEKDDSEFKDIMF